MSQVIVPQWRSPRGSVRGAASRICEEWLRAQSTLAMKGIVWPSLGAESMELEIGCDTLLWFDFRRSSSEPIVYTRQADGEQLVIGVYVDDLMITGSNYNDIKCFKSEMAKVFNMSDLGFLHYYLGIEVKQSAGGISLG
jgi:hypothetical protein